MATHKQPLFVNLDETTLKFNYGKNRGLVVMRRALPPGCKHAKENVSSSEDKAAVTLITFLTHDSSVQPKLPQVMLGNKHKFTLGLLKSLAPPPNFHMWREESGWNNKRVMCRLLTLLAKALAGYSATHQIILVLDVASCHRHRDIFAHATRQGIRLVFVPARLTFLLQPLDTSCFYRLKHRLRQKWMQLTVESDTGTLSHQVWLSAVFDVASELLTSVRWRVAFEAAGLLGEQLLSARVLGLAGWQQPPVVPDGLPSETQVKNIFPKRSKNSWNSLFSWSFPKPKAKAKAVAKPKCKAKAKGKAKAAIVDHGYAPNLD